MYLLLKYYYKCHQEKNILVSIYSYVIYSLSTTNNFETPLMAEVSKANKIFLLPLTKKILIILVLGHVNELKLADIFGLVTITKRMLLFHHNTTQFTDNLENI